MKKEALRSVSGLNQGGFESMSDYQWSNCAKAMNTFIDDVPAIERQLKSDFSAKRYDDILSLLTKFNQQLAAICADNLTTASRNLSGLINGLKTGAATANASEAEAALENFTQAISALSVDMQMASKRSSTSRGFTSPAAASNGNKNILAVDNAPMFLSTLKRLLKGQPYNLYCATSGEEALAFINNKTARVDIILLDVEMPDMDGYQLAQRLTAAGVRAPTLFITANSERHYVDRAIQVGAVGLLVKPLRIGQLLEKLQQFA